MTSNAADLLRAKQEYLRENLPFYLNKDFSSCNAHKLYSWQRDFLLVRANKVDGKLEPPPLCLLTAANQIGKSSVQIIKCINQAVRQDLWPFWFPKRKPRTFAYIMPESKQMTVEFKEKWEKVYLSRNEMKDHPSFGWKAVYGDKGQIDSIVFNSGVTCYFRSYSQSPTALQGHTLDCVFMDEEPPQAHFDELCVRAQASAAQGAGFVSCCFTATLGQEWLYRAMELQGTPQENLKGAWKRQISVFDCLKYADGSPSEIWTEDYIEKVLKPRYRSFREQERRLMGKFVKEAGLVFQEYEPSRNLEPIGTTDMEGWRSYVGIDYGSGGDFGHSSSIVHVKVDPTYSKARVVYVWSSEKARMTQADLLMRYKEIAAEIGQHHAYADWGAVDLFTLAAREGIRLAKAEKSHDIGIPLINTLLAEGQLKIITGGRGHAQHLIQELQTISEDKQKRHRKDDCSDALRYAISLCPMRLTGLKIASEKKRPDLSKVNRREAFYKGLDREDDPMRDDDDDDIGLDLDEAIDQFEEML